VVLLEPLRRWGGACGGASKTELVGGPWASWQALAMVDGRLGVCRWVAVEAGSRRRGHVGETPPDLQSSGPGSTCNGADMT